MNHYHSSKSDPFSDVIGLLRPHAAIAKPMSGRGRWGIRYEAYRQPGFALVLEGSCWLEAEGAGAVELLRGDFVLFPSTPAFSLYSEPGVRCVLREPSTTGIRMGDPDGDPDFQLLGGAFQIEPVNAPLLLSILPKAIHLRAAETSVACVASIIELITNECDAGRPGRDAVVQRLLEVMLVECLRSTDTRGPDLPKGLLAGLQDPALANALRLMHADVRHPWTVSDLARHAGMSRSAFSARFSERLGCAPIEYLARWRMALARDALARGDKSLDEVADEIGFESASAFSTAFRRRMGCPPGSFARALRAGPLPAPAP